MARHGRALALCALLPQCLGFTGFFAGRGSLFSWTTQASARSAASLTMVKELPLGFTDGDTKVSSEGDWKTAAGAVPDMHVPSVPVQSFDYVWARGPTLEPRAPEQEQWAAEAPRAGSHIAAAVDAAAGLAADAKRAGASQAVVGREPIRLTGERVPNIWMPVAHSGDIKAGGKPHKVMVAGVPVAMWRDLEGKLQAVSDVCIHRGASLSTGWTQHGRLVCPYHGFEFEGDGRLAHMPGVSSHNGDGGSGGSNAAGCGGRKAPAYAVQERGDWVFLFPEPNRPGAEAEFNMVPYTAAEALDPKFRAVEGTVEINGGVDACVENMLDLLHISYVHSFGNLNDPVPFDVRYETRYDDGERDPVTGQGGALQSSRVAFHYKSGPRSFSKTVGRSEEVVVTNEFHLPYTCVIRVFFGKSSVKTIMASAVPLADGRSALHWKLYRNFAMTHPWDAGPVNMATDWLFRKMMEITLQEDKEIIESLYPEYQKGFMSGKFDKQMLAYRKAIAHFQGVTVARASAATRELAESSLQVELLSKISGTRRGQAASPADRSAILGIIRSLENKYLSPSAQGPHPLEAAAKQVSAAVAGSTAAQREDDVLDSAAAAGDSVAMAADAATALGASGAAAVASVVSGAALGSTGGSIAAMEGAAREAGAPAPFDPAVEGRWHLEYISHAEDGSEGEQWMFNGPENDADQARLQALKQPGSEALMLDWGEKGRPMWADTEESVQIIDTKKGVLTNRATYKGWLGLTTTVQLEAMFKPLEEKANRFMVQFRQAIVDIGGQQITIPYFGRFSPVGWLETTYLNENIRIARGNKGSVFVLTRRPLSGGKGDSNDGKGAPQ